MKIVDSSYLKYNKLLLVCFGLWPYVSKRKRRFAYAAFGVSTVSLFIAMIEGLSNDTSTDLIIFYETIVAIGMVFGGFGQCTMLYIREHRLRELCEQINTNWLTTTDAEEIHILRIFSVKARTLMLIFIGSTFTGYCLFVAFNFLPLLINENSVKDQSKIFPYYSDRWIIKDEMRNIQIFFHAAFGILYAGIMYIVIIATYIGSVKNICGMYAIVSYRFKKLVKTDGIIKTVEIRNDKDIIPELLDIIVKHKEAVKGVHMLIKIFSRTFFVMELGLLICLGLLIFDVKYNINNVRLMFRMFFCALIFIIYVFYINYGGEQIIQSSNQIQSAAYFLQWYLISSKARQILLMIIRRTSKSDVLTASIMNLSLENFASILKASWSLATVILTTQKSPK